MDRLDAQPMTRQERDEFIASLRPIEPGTAARLRARAERMRARYGTMPVSSVELLHEGREEGAE